MAARADDADERWRAVLFELVKRANNDAEFRARVEATGAVIDNFEGLLERTRIDRTDPPGEIACHTYWWGFQLEIPHAVLASWNARETEPPSIATAIGVTGPAAAFRRRAAAWVASRIIELQQLDRGAGVYVSMTWMAPNIYLPTPVRR